MLVSVLITPQVPRNFQNSSCEEEIQIVRNMPPGFPYFSGIFLVFQMSQKKELNIFLSFYVELSPICIKMKNSRLLFKFCLYQETEEIIFSLNLKDFLWVYASCCLGKENKVNRRNTKVRAFLNESSRICYEPVPCYILRCFLMTMLN